jgi:hypothetical protein
MNEKATLIHDIRSRLPFVAVGHPDLAEEIGRAMDVVEAERPARPVIAAEMSDVTAYLWGLVLSFHGGPGHPGRAAKCRHWFCDPIRHAVVRQRDALVEAGYPDPMVENFKPEHRP